MTKHVSKIVELWYLFLGQKSIEFITWFSCIKSSMYVISQACHAETISLSHSSITGECQNPQMAPVSVKSRRDGDNNASEKSKLGQHTLSNMRVLFQDGLEMGLLHDTLEDGTGPLAVPKVTFILETLRDIARGMEHVHSYNILHSDLTAGNVLLDSTDAGIQGNRTFSAKVSCICLRQVPGLSPKQFQTSVAPFF